MMRQVSSYQLDSMVQWMDVMTGILCQQPHVSTQDKQLLTMRLQDTARQLGFHRENGAWVLGSSKHWFDHREEGRAHVERSDSGE